ncbi:MAG: sulfotransferase [Gammaproteobacteria bacterium HGW-Gammaproteobacteria-4]|nr:MAG: sulfotransferase [Gammaproteobacteria bacterium HGW-Gammaproteobacteria-4]
MSTSTRSTPPQLSFVIGGVQKAGTSALARYLGLHPAIRLPRIKEAHVFDAPDFDDSASTEQVDRRFASHFAADHEAGIALFGDATPIYLFHETLVQRIARYNPAMRWIILLRNPVDRALSHYHMERARGSERWPLWPALLLERWRLRGHRDDFSDGSPLRHFSYRTRGDYATQLDALYRHFPASQVLILHSTALRAQPDACMSRVYAFLGIDAPARAPDFAPVFSGDYQRPGRLSPTRLLLHWLLRKQRHQLRRTYGITFDPG